MRDRDPVSVLEPWEALPAALSCFLYFASASRVRHGRTIPPEALDGRGQSLLDWSQVRHGTLVLHEGMTARVVSPAAVLAADLGSTTSPVTVHQVREDPRRLRLFSLRRQGKAVLQVVDETMDDVRVLDALLDGTVPFAPWLDYAYVRRSQASHPDEYDVAFSLGRPLTYVEEKVATARAVHLLATHVPDVHAAQVLTDRHPAGGDWTELFDLRPLTAGRHLAVARDPGPWLTPDGPAPALLAHARRAVRDVLLTEELLAANPPPWAAPG